MHYKSKRKLVNWLNDISTKERIPLMTRDEHLAWAKQRALEYLNEGDLKEAFMSMLSDLKKHPELASHPGGMLGTMLMAGGHLGTPREVRDFIEGFR